MTGVQTCALPISVKFCMPYEDEMVRIAGIAQGSENEVFKKRAQSILKLLDAGK